MAADDLTGNMPTEVMLDYFNKHNIKTGLNQLEFDTSMAEALNVFPI